MTYDEAQHRFAVALRQFGRDVWAEAVRPLRWIVERIDDLLMGRRP
jgi:hypothetical protein